MTDDTDPTTTDAQHEPQLPASVREGLRDATTPLATTDPATDHDDLARVGARLGDAAVVGLGEATHGTREFLELKHRLLRHLVVEHDVRAVATEAPLPASMALHDYVVHGDGDPREALAALGSWVWQVESLLAVVEWLRAFNDGRPPGDRVAVHGVGAYHTHAAVERLRAHLGAAAPDVLDEVADDLAAVDDEGARPTAVDDVPGRVAAAERVVPRLRAHLDERRAAHVAATSERAWARARRYVAVLEQVAEQTAVLDAHGGDPAAAPTDDVLALPGRAMADNVAWVRDHEDADALVVWAHDAHLDRVAYTGPDTDAAAPSLGRHLAERHGEDYYALGFSFARGAFQAVSEGERALREQHLDGPLPGTLDAALHALDEPLAFVDLRAAREDERTADWLAGGRPKFRTGGTVDPDAPEDHLVSVPADALDGLCFVAETTRARPLDAGGGADGGDAGDTSDRS